jgi:predicted permease
MTLLISAGLFIKSLYNVSRVDLGIDTAELATFGVSPELNGYSPSAAQALFQRIEDELSAFPGITAVTASVVPLISGSNWGTSVAIEGFSNEPDIDRHTSFNEIGPAYFATLGIPLITGRELRPSDTLGAPKVALVNEAFARKFELGRDVVGKRLGRGREQEIDTEIVGLVADAKYSEIKEPVPPQLYLPYRQNEELATINFYVRSAGDPAALLPQIRTVVSRLDGNLPIENLRTMTSQVQESVVLDRMLTILSAAFAILATVLAAIGLYGVVSYRVSQRTREIGLRMALGADGPRVRLLILRQVAIMAVPGALAGIAAALGLGRLAASLLFELEGHDPLVIAAATLLLGLVALGAGLVPAQRAASIDPMQALRSE